MGKASEVRIPCSEEVRDRLWQAKRGREPYDSVLRKMLEQYDPDEAADTATRTTKSRT
jgi:hypothetical protein